jgi:hypothetical protein
MLELDEDFDPDARALCPDGNCTGVLDERGVCKVCGAQGQPAAPGAARPPAAPAPTGDETAAARAGEGDEEFDARQLCPDGNCIGLLGADGKCKVCGRSLT